jgi:hypothetical protein
MQNSYSVYSQHNMACGQSPSYFFSVQPPVLGPSMPGHVEVLDLEPSVESPAKFLCLQHSPHQTSIHISSTQIIYSDVSKSLSFMRWSSSLHPTKTSYLLWKVEVSPFVCVTHETMREKKAVVALTATFLVNNSVWIIREGSWPWRWGRRPGRSGLISGRPEVRSHVAGGGDKDLVGKGMIYVHIPSFLLLK